MNKKYLNISLIILTFTIIILIFKNNYIFYNSINNALIIFIKKVFPSLFIMMILNNLLIKLNFPYYFNKVFKNKYIYIFIMSALSGSPVNAVIINELLNNKEISEKDASIAISFTTFNNPLFLYNYLNLIIKNQKDTILVLMVIYISNIIIYLLYKRKLSNNKIALKYHNYNIKSEFFNIIYDSILKLLKIMGIILFLMTISNLLINNKPTILTSLIKGIIEVTQGLNELEKINAIIKIKVIIAYAIITFASFSIQLQLSIILEKHNINYKYFYLVKLINIILGLIIITVVI